MKSARAHEPVSSREGDAVLYGDSVGHYEGDTLVIDTVGIKIGPFAMVDMYGTPHTEKLHVVERYRLVDYAPPRTRSTATPRRIPTPARLGTSTPATGARCCSSNHGRG